MRGAVRDNLAYGVYRLLGATIGRLPPRFGYRIACWMGWLVYQLMGATRRYVTDNVRHVLGPGAGEARVQAVARQTCVSLAKGHYELFRLSRLSLEQVAQLTRLEGREHMEQALAQGKGVVVVTAHLGNLDIAGQIPLVYGVPMTIVAGRTRPERLFAYISKKRARLGLQLIPSDESMLGLFRALKRGELIALACDRDFIGNGRVVEFFGSPTRLPDGPVRIALRTGAAVLPAFVTRLPGDRFVVNIEPTVLIPRTGDPEADVANGMRMILAILERRIGEHPEQWLVASPVWQATN